MATKKKQETEVPTPTEDEVLEVLRAPCLNMSQEGQVRNMINDAAANAEHHARASVTSNELQLFAAMAMQGMLANRSNVGLDPHVLARKAVAQADALQEAIMSTAAAEEAAYDEE